MKIYRLTDDYLKIDSEVTTLFKGQYREAPVLFKRNGIYYLITSFATGTKPNPQYYSMAKSMRGPWSENRLLCSRRTWNTYYAQGACEFTVCGSQDTNYIYNLDRWVKPMRHIWLPLEFNADGTIKPLEWHDEWRIDAKTGLAIIPPAPAPLANNLARGKHVTATYDSPGEMFDYGHFANHEPELAVDGNPDTFWSPNDNLPHWLKVDLLKPTNITGTQLTFWKQARMITESKFPLMVKNGKQSFKPIPPQAAKKCAIILRQKASALCAFGYWVLIAVTTGRALPNWRC